MFLITSTVSEGFAGPPYTTGKNNTNPLGKEKDLGKRRNRAMGPTWEDIMWCENNKHLTF